MASWWRMDGKHVAEEDGGSAVQSEELIKRGKREPAR